MGYTSEDPPLYVSPLLEQYDELKVDSCGYEKGSWIKIKDTRTGDRYELTRTITYEIEVRKNGVLIGNIDSTIVNKDFSSVSERDKKIGDKVGTVLGGFDSFDEAIRSNF